MSAKYKAHEGEMSALDAMPTAQAETRAKRFPVAGDRWQEMYSYWVHVDKVTDADVLVRCYVGPCAITPDEARDVATIPRHEFADWVERAHLNYDGNALWSAKAGGFYAESFLDKPTHWKTTVKP